MKCGDISSVRNIWKMMDRRVLIREVGLYLYTNFLFVYIYTPFVPFYISYFRIFFLFYII